jgi:hypothetical protein
MGAKLGEMKSFSALGLSRLARRSGRVGHDSASAGVFGGTTASTPSDLMTLAKS